MLTTLVSVALACYYFGKGKVGSEVLANASLSHNAYLSKRFESAYESEAASIAVWEGTNLITYCEKNSLSGGAYTREEAANLLYINARLYVLFCELGDTNSAEKAADEAAVWFRHISTNNTNKPHDIIEKVLARDRLKRKIGMR